VFAAELLNVATPATSQTVFDDLGGLAEDAGFDVADGFNDSCLDLSSQGEADLNSPYVLALHTSIVMVGA